MKSRLILAASLLAFSGVLLPASYAAADAPAEKATANADVKKAAKPHSHMVDKTGNPAGTPDAKPAMPKKALHDHNQMHK